MTSLKGKFTRIGFLTQFTFCVVVVVVGSTELATLSWRDGKRNITFVQHGSFQPCFSCASRICRNCHALSVYIYIISDPLRPTMYHVRRRRTHLLSSFSPASADCDHSDHTPQLPQSFLKFSTKCFLCVTFLIGRENTFEIYIFHPSPSAAHKPLCSTRVLLPYKKVYLNEAPSTGPRA
jgi:hypothetical protein